MLNTHWGARKKHHAASVVFRRKRNGHNEILLQHRSPLIWGGTRPDKGPNTLSFPGGRAHWLDKLPIVTAWRESKEECAPYSEFTLSSFRACVVNVLYDNPVNLLFVVDADKLQFLGCVPWDWDGYSGLAPSEICYDVVSSGHAWITSQQVMDALRKDNNLIRVGSGDGTSLPLWNLTRGALSKFYSRIFMDRPVLRANQWEASRQSYNPISPS